MEDHNKMIAKIQHFYEVLQRKIDDANALAIMQVSHKNNEKNLQISSDLTEICNEYSRIFNAFLYTESP